MESANITEREREVLILVAQNYSTREIAEKLGISPRTVNVHRGNAMRALRIHGTAAIVRFAIEQGWIAVTLAVAREERAA